MGVGRARVSRRHVADVVCLDVRRGHFAAHGEELVRQGGGQLRHVHLSCFTTQGGQAWDGAG